jgi:hypothetical protein
MLSRVRSRAILLSDLHNIASEIERHNWSRIIHAPSDWKRAEEHRVRAEKLWQEVELWKKTLDEQVEVAKKGEGWDRSKLCLSG